MIVIVAALVNGNDAVSVNDAVNAHGAISFVSIATIGFEQLGPSRVELGVDQHHDIVPFHERGHDHGGDHVHD